MADASDAVFRFRCKCAREWQEVWPVPIRCDALATRLRQLTCPTCAAEKTAMLVVDDEE